MFWTSLLLWATTNWAALVFRVGPLLVLATVLSIQWFTGTPVARLGMILVAINLVFIALEVVGYLPKLPAITVPPLPVPPVK